MTFFDKKEHASQMQKVLDSIIEDHKFETNNPMKTPTPEEVKNNVAMKHGFKDWYGLVLYHVRANKHISLTKITDEVMRDYAEALYTERIEKASNDLPSESQMHDWKESKLYVHAGEIVEPDYSDTYDWMKQAASLVIAKERMTAHNLRESLKKQILIAEQKDKEIEQLRNLLQIL